MQIAIGSRAVVGSQIEISQPTYRIAMGKVINLLIRVIALGGIHDTQCGFKLFTREAAQEVFRRQTLHGFGFDVENLFIARRLGLQIAEVPIRWMDSSASKIDAIRDSWVMLQDIFRVRWNDHAGKYRQANSPSSPSTPASRTWPRTSSSPGRIPPTGPPVTDRG